MQTLNQVLEKLKQEHNPNYVYRGQIKEYEGPLVSSTYRQFVRKSKSYESRNLPPTLRKTTNGTFVERALSGSSADKETALDYQRRQVRSIIRMFFGYAFTEVLSQQAGLASESLDVTSDPEVAAFFATHNWKLGNESNVNYFPHKPLESESIGIIYRWKVERPMFSLENIKSWSYTYCPPILDSCAILKIFTGCDSLSEFINSLEEYQNFFINDLGIMEYQGGDRPLELLKLPRELQFTSRIMKQKALLLVPDVIENKQYWETYYPDFPRPDYGFWNGGPLIEDFSKSRNVEKFYFTHTKEQTKYINISAHDIDGRDDVELGLTTGWMHIFLTPHKSVMPIHLIEDIDLSFIDIFHSDIENIESKLQSGIAGGRINELELEISTLSETIDRFSLSKLDKDTIEKVYLLTDKCFDYHAWKSGIKLLKSYRAKISIQQNMRDYLWASERICLMLQRDNRYNESRTIAEDIINLCEHEYLTNPSPETARLLSMSYILFVVLLKNFEVNNELIEAYKKFIYRFQNDLYIKNDVSMAHILHWYAEKLDEEHKFSESLIEYDKIISIVRKMPKTDEEVSSLVVSSTYSKANCLERLGYLELAEKEFRALAIEFENSQFLKCRNSSKLAYERANRLLQLK